MKNINIIAMAGMGRRFKEKNIKTFKPLYLYKRKPIFYYAVKSLPKSNNIIFVCTNKDLKKYKLISIIKSYFKKSSICKLKKKTKGQAITCRAAIKNISNNEFVTFGSCDYSYSFNELKFKNLIKISDLIIFVNKPTSENLLNTDQYGWVKRGSGNEVLKIECKKLASSKPKKDYVIVGAFSFKSKFVFTASFNEMLKKREIINNEYYMDTLAKHSLKLGFRVSMIKVSKYQNLGTPESILLYEK